MKLIYNPLIKKNLQTIPDKTSDLTNDSGFVTASALPDLVQTRRDTNGSDQIIPNGYSAVVYGNYYISGVNTLSIQGDGTLTIL